nr:putative polyprotein [Tanacetum cinerariifolium]
WFEDRLCVPSDQALREKVMTEAHSSLFTVYPGSTKMYRDLKQYFSWNGMKQDVATKLLDCMALQLLLCPTEIRGLRLVFGRDYRKPGELGLSSVHHFILKPMDEYLCLVEFPYNNSWHASIKATPFELLYGRKCRVPICWNEVGERLIEGPKLIEINNEKVVVAKEKLKEDRSRQKKELNVLGSRASSVLDSSVLIEGPKLIEINNEKVVVAKEKLKEARSRQKSYANKHRRDLEF